MHNILQILLFCTLCFVFTTVVHSQADTPLVGPLIAVTTAQQDRILLYDLGGKTSTIRTLRFGVGEIHVWDFSPQGCRILFTQDTSENGLPKLFTVRLDGGDIRSMAQYDELPSDSWGVWEPDWSVVDKNGVDRIAFTMIRDQSQLNGEIKRETYTAYIPGSGGELIFYSVTGQEFSPQYSYDGTWLVYVSYDERIAGVDIHSTAVPTQEPPPGIQSSELPTLTEADIWVVGADGENKRRVTAFEVGSVRQPRWSPDGDLIGFVHSPSPSNDTLWMIGSQPNANPTQLSFLWNLTLDHTWLPDSSAMLAAVRDFQEVSVNRLWRIPLIGNADSEGGQYFEDNPFDYTDYPRFSADGNYLAFRSNYNLIVVNIELGVWQRLDEIQPGNTPPVWSPASFKGETNC